MVMIGPVSVVQKSSVHGVMRFTTLDQRGELGPQKLPSYSLSGWRSLTAPILLARSVICSSWHIPTCGPHRRPCHSNQRERQWLGFVVVEVMFLLWLGYTVSRSIIVFETA